MTEDDMKIGIIGAGNLGTGLGKRLAAKGYDIVVSFARDFAKVRQAATTIGGGARPGTPQDAASHGAIVILATPWAVTLETVRALAPALAGKIVWDATNSLKSDMSGLAIGTTTSGGEEIAKAAPAAKVVKAIPPFAELLNSSSMHIAGARPGVFVCGDDVDARKIVLELVNAVDAEGVDAGPLELARYTEPAGLLLAQLAYVHGLGARIGLSLLRDAAPGRAA